ncbi:hypothetical protein SDC9_64206 [bioreactor metagenome]|uniref:Uncharacterized protein n=1 Tax=bioreactor metagenome TaxID=1076179 RepID=A0A644XPA4_9ZZZZ
MMNLRQKQLSLRKDLQMVKLLMIFFLKRLRLLEKHHGVLDNLSLLECSFLAELFFIREEFLK